MVAEELRGGDGVVVRVEGDGTLRVGWGESDWFGPARLTLAGARKMPALSTTRRDGADDLGAFAGAELHWAPHAPALQATVRVYRDRPLIVFRLAAPDGLRGGAVGPFEVPRVAWPHFQPLRR